MDTSHTKTYYVDKHKQLIPLNGSMANFSCYFEIKSKDNKPFNIGIVEQNELKPKEYKLVENGLINGEIQSDGTLKNYFLVLKAPNACELDVRIVLKEKQQPPPTPTPHMQHQSAVGMAPVTSYYFQPKYIMWILISFILIYLLYKYRYKITRTTPSPCYF